MAENWLCRLRLHKAVYPLRGKRVGWLQDVKLCARCLKQETYYSGWYRYEDAEEYFDPVFVLKLEKSCVFGEVDRMLKGISNVTTRWNLTLDLVERRGFDVSEERKLFNSGD